MVADIKTGGITSQKLQKLRRKIKDLASGPAQGALRALPALHAPASTCANRTTHTEYENTHLG